MSKGTLADAVKWARNPKQVNVVRGQRVVFQIGAGGLLVRQFQQLLRAEDPGANAWDVTISPVFINQNGPDARAMPAFGTSNGGVNLAITWGGGGVSWRQTVAISHCRGACFTLAGENIMLEVAPADLVNVFTPLTVPALVAWAKPSTGASPRSLIIATEPGTLVAAVPGFARHLIATKTPLAATFDLVWEGFGGAITQSFTAADSLVRIPVPEFAQRVTVVPSAGATINLQWELVFS